MTEKVVKFSTSSSNTTVNPNNGNNGSKKKPLTKEELFLQQELDKMMEERNDLSSKARDIEQHLERAEYQLEDNKKVNDLLTKAANASERLLIDIEKHSDATRKQITDVDKSFTLGLKQFEESNDIIDDQVEREEEEKMLEKDNSMKMKEDYEKKLSSAVSNLTKLFSEGKKEYRKLELGPPPTELDVDPDEIDIDQARIIIPQLKAQIVKLNKDVEVADMKNRATYVQWYSERAKLDDFADHCKKDVESITYRMIAAENKVRHNEQVARDPSNVEGAVSRKELDDVLLECEKLRVAYVKEYEEKVRLQQLLKAAHHEIDEKSLLIQSLQHSKIELNMQMAQMTVKQKKLDEQINNMKAELERMLQESTAEMQRQFQSEKDALISQIDPLQHKLQHQKILIDDLNEKLADRNDRIEKLEQELSTTKEELEKALKLLASTMNKDLIMNMMSDMNNISIESMDLVDKRMTTEIQRVHQLQNSLDTLKNMLLNGNFNSNKSRPPSERQSVRTPVIQKVKSSSIDETEMIIDSNEARVESSGYIPSPVEIISRSNSPVAMEKISRAESPIQLVRSNTPIPKTVQVQQLVLEKPVCIEQQTQTELLVPQKPKPFSLAKAKEIAKQIKIKRQFDPKQLTITENDFDESLTTSLSSLGQIFYQNLNEELNVDEMMTAAANNTYDIIMSVQEKVQVVERLKTPVVVERVKTPVVVERVVEVDVPQDNRPIPVPIVESFDDQSKKVKVDMINISTETSPELWNAALEEYMSRQGTPQLVTTDVPLPVIELEEDDNDDDLDVTEEELALRQEAQENLLGEMLQENFQRLIGKGFGSEILVKLTLVNHHLEALTKEDGSGMTGNKLQISSMKVERKLLTREVIDATSIPELSSFKVETEKHITLLSTFNALKLLHHYKTGGIFLDVLNKHRSTIDDCIAAAGGWQKAYQLVIENEESMASTTHWPDFFRLKVLEYLREKLFREKELIVSDNEITITKFKEREIDYENNISHLEQEKQGLIEKLNEIERKKRDRNAAQVLGKLRRSSAQIVVPDAVYGAIALSSSTESATRTLTPISETTETTVTRTSKPPTPVTSKPPTPIAVIKAETPKSYTPVTSKPTSAHVPEIKEDNPIIASLRTLHKLINRIIIRFLNNDHEAQCLTEGILGALLAWEDGYFGDAREHLEHCIANFSADPEISIVVELLKLLTSYSFDFVEEVAEIKWLLEQMVIFQSDQLKKSKEISLPAAVLEPQQSKFGKLVNNNMQDIIKKNNIANEMASHRLERQRALEEAKRKEAEMLARWKHDLKIAVEKEIEERRPDIIDGTCQTDPLENDRDVERILSREREKSGSRELSRGMSRGANSRGGNKNTIEEETNEGSREESSQLIISRQGSVGHPFASPLPPGFHLVHFRDNELELCPGIFLASAAKHRIFAKQLPKKVVYIYRGQDAALSKGIQRLPSYISVPPIPDCEPVIIPSIFDLCDGVKLIHGSNLGEHNEIELPPDILVVKMSRDAILPNGLTIVELSDIVKVPMVAEIPFGFELVQISTSVVLPHGVEISEGIFTAPCPKTLQLPPNVLLVKRDENAKFPSFLRPMASTTYEEIEVSIHNKISQGCTLVCKPPGVPFSLGEEVLYRIPGHDLPAGMRHVCCSDYSKGLHLSRNLEIVQLTPRFDLPDTCSPAPGWFAYPRPFGMRLPANVHLFICDGDLNSGFISLPTCLREVSMPDIPPAMKIPKKVIAAEFFSDDLLPEETIVAPGIKVLSIRKYLASLNQSSSYSLPINAILVERQPGSILPEGVERGSCSDLPFGHLLGPCIEVLMLSVRFELPAGVKMEPHLVLGQRTQLAPGTILSRDLEVVEWPRFFILPPGLELVKLKPGTDIPAGYVRAQIPAADPINKKIPVGCIIVHLPYISAVPSLQQLTENIEIVSPRLLTADEKNAKSIELPMGLILISREDRENMLPGELKIAPKSSLPDKLKNSLAKYNVNARYNSGAKLIEAVQLQPQYSLPPGTEIFQGVFVLPRPHWMQLPNGAELVSVWNVNETNIDLIKKYEIRIRPDLSPHATINQSDVILPPDFHVILLPERYQVFSWQSIAPGIDVVSKPDNIILPPNHFLIQRSKMQSPPPGLKIGFAVGYEHVGTRTKLPPGIEVMHLTASYSLPLGVDITDTSVLGYDSKDKDYNIEMPRNERLSCGFTILSNPYNFKSNQTDDKKYVFVAVDRKHFTWPKNSDLHPNSDEIVMQHFNHFAYNSELLENMKIRRTFDTSNALEAHLIDPIKITDYIKYIELPKAIPNIRSRLREEISIIKAFVESFRGQSIGQMSIEDIVHTGSFSEKVNDADNEINATRAVVIYPRVRVEYVTIQSQEQKAESQKDFSKLEISNALISHFVDDDGEPLEIDEKLLMKIIESFKSEISVLEKENNEYRLKFSTLHRDHEQLKIRFGRLQSQQASHADEVLEQKKLSTTLKSSIAKLERKLALKLEDLKLSRNAHEDTKIRMQAQIDVLATQVAHWRDANIDFVTQKEAYEKEFESLKQNLKLRQAENIAHGRKECALVIDFLVQSMFQVFKRISQDAYNNAKTSLSQKTNIMHRDVISLKPIEPILKPRPISADSHFAELDPDLISPSIDDYHDDSTKGDSTKMRSTYTSQLVTPRMNDDDDVSVLTDDASSSNFLSKAPNNFISNEKSIQEVKSKELEFIKFTSKINVKNKDIRQHVNNEHISIPTNELMHDGPHVYLRANHHDNLRNSHLHYHVLNDHETSLKSEQEMLSELENLGKDHILSAIDIISLYFNQVDNDSNLDDFQMVIFGNEDSNVIDIHKPKAKDYSSYTDINAVIAEAKHGMSLWMDHASSYVNNFLDIERKNFTNGLDMLEREVKIMTTQNRALQRRYESLAWKFSEFARRNVQSSLLPIDDLRDKIFEQAITIDRLKDESMKPLLEEIRLQAENVTRLKTMESHLKLFVLQYNEMAASKEDKCKRATSDGEAKAYRHNAAMLRKKAGFYKERLSNIQQERELIVSEISKKLQEFEGAVIGVLPPKLLKVLNWSHNHSADVNSLNNSNFVYTPLATDDNNSIASNTNSTSKNYNHYYISSNESIASLNSNSTGSSKRIGSLSSSLSINTLPANMFSTYSPSALGKMTVIDPAQKIKQLKSFKQKKY